MKTRWIRNGGCLLLTAALLASTSSAEVEIAALFSDHMVLQRDRPVPVWGRANPGEQVTITLAGQSHTGTADAKGRWTIRLDPLPAGGPHTLTISASNTLTIEDILIGEVWLCSGQSNMAMPVKRALQAEKEIAAARFPQIRMVTLARRAAGQSLDHCQTGGWQICSPETVGRFSATAYYFGRNLHRFLQVPVGLVTSSWGGTAIESWIPSPALGRLESGRSLIERWQKKASRYDPEQARRNHEKRLQSWQAQQKNNSKGRRTRKPRAPIPPDRDPNAPGSLYNGMIAPLVPFAIRGVIWYQGERNASRILDALEYREELPCLIASWRHAWGRGDFPFLFVQLPNFGAKDTDALALNRESMLHSLRTPHTGMAITIDIGETHDIHPKNKQDVGLRLAWLARKIAYGEDRIASGPIYRSMEIRGGQIVLQFDHIGGGLVARGDILREFEIAGEDRRFVPAQTKIREKKIVVWSDSVPQPKAVRYAWTNDPKCNLYNREGLPASPFRSDRWPIPTRPK